MRWSWTVGRLVGIKVQVHWTFLILIAWVILVHASEGASVPATIGGVLLVLAVFACVVLHELGHALAARRFQIGTKDITLLPIGGVARLERIPDEPRQELVVAAAGPAVNVVIAGLLAALLWSVGGLRPVTEILAVGGSLVAQLMWVNIALVAFNLLPAFPMDGGRMLRAVLATRMTFPRATRLAAGIGQGFAVVLGFLGLAAAHPFLIFIAVFVYLGAQAEAQQAQVRSALEGVLVRDAMMVRFRTLRPTHTLDLAVQELLAGAQQDFPVVDERVVVGMLTRADLVRAIKEGGGGKQVADVMRRDCVLADGDDELHAVLARMREKGCTSAAVLDHGRLAGLLTLENVGEFLMVHSGSHYVSASGV